MEATWTFVWVMGADWGQQCAQLGMDWTQNFWLQLSSWKALTSNLRYIQRSVTALLLDEDAAIWKCSKCVTFQSHCKIAVQVGPRVESVVVKLLWRFSLHFPLQPSWLDTSLCWGPISTFGFQVCKWQVGSFSTATEMLGVMVDTAERGVVKVDNKESRKQDLVAELQKILQCGVPTNYRPF